MSHDRNFKVGSWSDTLCLIDIPPAWCFMGDCSIAVGLGAGSENFTSRLSKSM